MQYFLFWFYLVIIIWLVPKISFIKNSGLSKKEIRGLFLLKALVGIGFAFYLMLAVNNNDYLSFNEAGKQEYQLLLSSPKAFFTTFGNLLHGSSSFLQALGGFI